MANDTFIDIFIAALSQKISSDLLLTVVDNGIFAISIQDPAYTIYCYADQVAHRIATPVEGACIHIDEDQIRHYLPKLIARLQGIIQSPQKIYARQTVVARLTKKVCVEFQEEHHLQKPLAGKYRYGLYHNGELVSVGVFSAGRRMNDQADDYRSFELLRFCHKHSTIVVGGLSKLIKSFAQDFKANDVMTYVDLDWSQDSNLKKIGFAEESRTEVQYYWIGEGERQIFKEKSDAKLFQESQQFGHVKANSGSIKMVLHLHN